MDNQSKQTTIYIGLNDSETGVQKFDSEKYLSILKNACKNYKVAFSVQELNGGYFHEDGRYTEENTLMLMLIDAPEQIVEELAKDLCAFLYATYISCTVPWSELFFGNSASFFLHLLQAIRSVLTGLPAPRCCSW